MQDFQLDPARLCWMEICDLEQTVRNGSHQDTGNIRNGNLPFPEQTHGGKNSRSWIKPQSVYRFQKSNATHLGQFGDKAEPGSVFSLHLIHHGHILLVF